MFKILGAKAFEFSSGLYVLLVTEKIYTDLMNALNTTPFRILLSVHNFIAFNTFLIATFYGFVHFITVSIQTITPIDFLARSPWQSARPIP